MTYCIVTLFLTLKRVERYGKKEGDKLHFLFTTQQFSRFECYQTSLYYFLSQKLSEYMVTTVLFSFEQSKQ